MFNTGNNAHPRTNFKAGFLGNGEDANAEIGVYAIIFVVYDPLGMEKLDLEVHPMMCVILRVIR